MDGIKSVQLRRPREAGERQLYNPVPQTVRVSWSSRQAEFSSRLWFPVVVGDKMPLLEPAPDRGLGSSGPRLSNPKEWGRSASTVKGSWGQYVAVSVPSPTHLSHTTLSQSLLRIKCERYIFLKKCVRSSLLLIMFPLVYVYSCICITAMQQF